VLPDYRRRVSVPTAGERVPSLQGTAVREAGGQTAVGGQPALSGEGNYISYKYSEVTEAKLQFRYTVVISL